MALKISSLILSLLVFSQISVISTCDDTKQSFCDDWTLCQRVRCAAPPEICPAETPFKLMCECGCCEFCSECPRKGPCGTCGVEVKCKEDYPTCKENQITSLDYCGCCRVCKDLLDEGDKCESEGPVFAVCKDGLRCVHGKCSDKTK